MRTRIVPKECLSMKVQNSNSNVNSIGKCSRIASSFPFRINEHRNRVQLAQLAQEHALALVETRSKKMKTIEHVLIKEGMGNQPKDQEELVRIVLNRYPEDHTICSDSNIKFLVGILSRQQECMMPF